MAPSTHRPWHASALLALSAAAVLLKASSTSAASCGATTLDVGFNDWNSGFSSGSSHLPYKLSNLNSDFPGGGFKRGYWDDGLARRAWLTKDGGNPVLETLFPRGCIGQNQCSMQVKHRLDQPLEEGTLSYRFKFSDGFDFMKGGKMPGMCGGPECWTGCTPNLGDDWSARIMWRRDGEMALYMYENSVQRHNNCGNDLAFGGGFRAERNRWYTLTQYIKMNSPGQNDGVIKAWIDDQEMVSSSDLNFRRGSTTRINFLYFSSFFGGGDQTWAPKQDMTMQFDDFKLRDGMCSPGNSGQDTAFDRGQPSPAPEPAPKPAPSPPEFIRSAREVSPTPAPAPSPSSGFFSSGKDDSEPNPNRMTRSCKLRKLANLDVKPGQNLERFTSRRSQCSWRCKVNAQCVSFTYVEGTGACYLKDAGLEAAQPANGVDMYYCA